MFRLVLSNATVEEIGFVWVVGAADGAGYKGCVLGTWSLAGILENGSSCRGIGAIGLGGAGVGYRAMRHESPQKNPLILNDTTFMTKRMPESI